MWLVQLLHCVIPLVRLPAIPALHASFPVGTGMEKNNSEQCKT